jgi:hypothetical protein
VGDQVACLISGLWTTEVFKTLFGSAMRSFRIDQFEFESPGSEEAVEIDIARQSSPYPDIGSFIGATVGVDAAAALVEPTPFHLMPDRVLVSEHIKRFANIEIPLHSAWLTYQLTADSSDDTHVAI